MDLRAVAFVLGHLLLVVGGCLVVPLGFTVAVEAGEARFAEELFAFAAPALAALVLGGLLRWRCRVDGSRIGVREGFAIVTGAWLAAALFGMVPYLATGAAATWGEAFFETVSGFTTTGASIFPRVEVLPDGLQFWRCMTQWLGGMGIVVLSVALLPMLGAGGYRLLKAETPGGVVFERERPRIADTAKALWLIYVGLTTLAALAYWLAGMSPFDAVCHAFTTLSTGGFSPHTESIAYFGSPVLQWLVILFMATAGINFGLYALLLRRRWRAVADDAELRWFAALVAGAVVLGVIVVPRAGELEPHLRAVAFSVVSLVTTTGYATADFDAWPPLVRLVLVLGMVVGGCMGSTAGGMKVARVGVFAKAVTRELHRPIYPHAVRPLRWGRKVLEPDLVANLMAFGSLYTMTFLAGALVMAACDYDLVTSLTASIAALSNIGPGLGLVGPTQSWAHLPEWAKWAMSLVMLAGRLELFSVFVLLTPWAWRR